MIPFDRTAHGWKLLFRPIPCVGDLLHRFKQVAASVRDGRHSRRIETTLVLQLILCIETEEIGRALRALGARHFLGRIDHVGKSEAMPRCERLHVVEGVLGIVLGVVWHDGDCPNPDLA